VRGFDESVWVDRRFDLVVRGNSAKFGQPPSLKAFLICMGTQVLVEVSPMEPIWGGAALPLRTDRRKIRCIAAGRICPVLC
jgi:predicted NAD-dependent protein-ADP-ribosyltransferase YbiA (DUF1768 family)